MLQRMIYLKFCR